MQINPPTLFWMAIAAILAADRFLPLARFEQPGLPWYGARHSWRRPLGSREEARIRMGRCEAVTNG